MMTEKTKEPGHSRFESHERKMGFLKWELLEDFVAHGLRGLAFG